MHAFVTSAAARHKYPLSLHEASTALSMWGLGPESAKRCKFDGAFIFFLDSVWKAISRICLKEQCFYMQNHACFTHMLWDPKPCFWNWSVKFIQYLKCNPLAMTVADARINPIFGWFVCYQYIYRWQLGSPETGESWRIHWPPHVPYPNG